MKETVEDRAEEHPEYILQNQTTLPAPPPQNGNTNTTQHMDVAKRLERINPSLYQSVREVLDVNKAQRHIRGGLATREKYKHSAKDA